MLLDPLEDVTLVQQSDIQIAILPDPLVRKEPPQADAVVKVDEDDVPAGLPDDLRPVVVGIAVFDVAWS